MEFSTPPSTSEIPETQKEEVEGFDLLKSSKIETGANIDLLEEIHSAGFRFNPNDYDLVIYYLFNKIADRILPITGLIKEIHDLYEYDPNQLSIGDFRHGRKSNEAFYFTYIEHIYSSKGKETRRTTKGGYWKATDDEEEFTYRNSDVTVGFKSSMVFFRGQAPNGTKTPFAMDEYRLNPSVVPVHVLNETIRTKIERYVVWRIINTEAPS